MSTVTQDTRPRYHLIDAARGLSIILMVFYHLGYDLFYYCGLPEGVLFNPLLDTLQFIFASLFIFMSGASSRLSRSNAKRGLKILGAAALVTLATYFIIPDVAVTFGILHFLGSSALIYALLRPLLDRIPVIAQPFIYVALYAVTSLATQIEVKTPWLSVLGFRSPEFISADYFPLLPWIFTFFLGTWFGRLVVDNRLPRWFYDFNMPFLPAVGRRTIWIYLAHQPVLMGVVYVIRLIQGAPL